MSRRFSFVGLGKLGASMAASIASRGHEVIAVDVNHRAVEALNAGRAPVQETGLQALEQHSGKRAGADLGVCYSPEFIALGSVIHDFLHPDFLLIGKSDTRSGGHLEACYREIVPAEVPVRRMTLENAELAKLALN